MRRGYVPPRQRCTPTIAGLLWARLFPPSYRDPEFPWPIPWWTAHRWGQARYLRSIRMLSWESRWRNTIADLRLLCWAIGVSLALVAAMDVLVNAIAWGLR